MNLYCIRLQDNLSEDIISLFTSIIDIAKLEKIKKYRNPMDFRRSLIADVLVRACIKDILDINYYGIPFQVSEYGKPYINSNHQFNFNCTHSGEWIVCAIDTYPIGVDVEKINELDILEIAYDYFSYKEYRALLAADGKSRHKLFYDIWTLKESYLKTLGIGLSADLKSFSLSICNQQIVLETNLLHNRCFFKQYNIDPNYKLSVCSFNNAFPEKLIYIDLIDLQNKILQ